jgi:2-C-methyl-D-erythritol 4-phosphate cytidylyltransferase
MSVIVLIPAAGMGSRMGSAVHKQYLTLAGRPILAHTLALFDAHPAIDHIYLISPVAEVVYCQTEIVDRYGFVKVRGVVGGGRERQESVRLGLEACAGVPGDVIVIHDGVRPFFPARLIEPLLATAGRVGACLLGVPVKETVKVVERERVTATPDRRTLWLAQTPQVFRYELLVAAHRSALEEDFLGTDDASLVERLGAPVAILHGSYRNIKITTPEDLALARTFLAAPGEP